jgi:hypothetical protein
MQPVVTEISSNAVSCRQVQKEFVTGDNRALVLRGVDFDVSFGEMTRWWDRAAAAKPRSSR